MIQQILNLASSLSTQADSEPLIVNGIKLTGADSDEDTIVSLLATQKGVTESEVKEEIANLCKKIREIKPVELFKQNVDLKSLHWLEGLTAHNLYSFLQVDKAANIYFKTKYLTPLGFQDTPVKILDATGDKRIAQLLTGRNISLVTADVKWDAKKTHIKTETSRRVLKHATDSDLKRTIERAISKISGKKVLLLTYQFLEERVLKIAREIDPSKEYVGYHFLGPRGINSLSDCDSVIALGLSYQNINSSLQDACILFPRKEDEEFRHNWSDLCMGWELVQSIHRIRPVNKLKVEIVLISSFWPQILPPPDEIIDLSKGKNWKEKAISALEPFVREFGFLTPDIGYLANVYVQSKEEKAQWFQGRVAKLLSDYVARSSMLSRLNHSVGLLSGWRKTERDGLLNASEAFLKAPDEWDKMSHQILDIYNIYIYALVRNETYGHCACLQDENRNQNQAQNRDKILAHLILDIYNVYIYALVRHGKEVFSRILKANPEGYRLDTINAISLSNKQWADLLIQLQDKYPSFEQFEIKLPHTNGKAIKGVGIKKEVLNFYRDLSQLGIIGKVNLQTYKTLANSTVSITPLPDGVLVFHLPEDLQGMLQVGFEDEVQSFSTETDRKEIQAFLHDRLEKDSVIISNHGKSLAKVFRSSGIESREIHDIILYQRIIKNGEIHKALSIEELFKQYELSEKPDSITLFSQMWQVWEAQKKTISELHLEQTVRLENRILWVVADLEINGIGVDAYGMIEYQDQIRDELRAVEEEISSGLPADFNWKDQDELKRYLNTTFSLSLTGTGKECLPLITHAEARSIMESVLRYRSLEKTNNDIERYLVLVGEDDRAHDSIDQLGTKTGRITRDLQTVKKVGPIRSFFRAEEGYKFVIADYSQFEVRVLTGLSGDKAALDIFRNRKDFFSEVASIGFNIGQNGKSYRKIVKPIVHGYHNGRGMYSIYDSLQKEGIDISLYAVEDFLSRYCLNFLQFFDWLDKSVKDAFQKGYAVTPLGRRLNVSSTTDSKSVSNFPIQGTASDGFKLALIALDDRLRGLDASIVHVLHDEIIVEVKAEIAEAVAEIMKECMEKAFGKIFKGVPFEANPTIATSWGQVAE
jgi:DNA polymerase I-like protein with 3'-5' exonuclease and polymerase domains